MDGACTRIPAAASDTRYCSMTSGVSGPAGLNVRIAQYALHFDQNGGRKHQRMRTGYDREQKVAGETLRRDLWIGADQYVRIENDSHGCQTRCGRRCVSASSRAASISSAVVSAETCDAIASR